MAVFAAATPCTEPITVEAARPDLLLVVDRSRSMAEQLGVFAGKWQVMRDAISSVVSAHDSRIQFGLMRFPDDAMCGPGTVDVPPGPGTTNEILSTLAATFPDGATPTHTTLTGALDHYAQTALNPAGQYVLLATDGLPNCNPNFNDTGSEESIQRVAALMDEGVTTYVLGFGSAGIADPTTLTAMAQAGGTGDFFPANSPEELDATLSQIAQAVTPPTCTYPLDRVPDDPSALRVSRAGWGQLRAPAVWGGRPGQRRLRLRGAGVHG